MSLLPPTFFEQQINAVLQPLADPKPSGSGLPHVTHAGVLELVPGLRMNVYRLSNGEAVIDEASFSQFLDFLGFDQPTRKAKEATNV